MAKSIHVFSECINPAGSAPQSGFARLVQRGLRLLVVLLVTAVPARADSKLGDYTVTRWSRENGLADNSVTCLTQTRDGFLWIGTANGLARFDGLKFVPLSLSGSGAGGAKDISALYQDAQDRLWIGTRGDGLWCLTSGNVSRFNPRPGFLCPAVTCIAGDHNGGLWVGTTNGLSWLQGTNVTLFTTREGLPSEIISSVHISGPNAVWITTRKGMCQFKDGRLSPLEFQTDTPGSSPEMIGMYNDQTGNLWAFGDTYLVNLNDGKRFNYFRSGDTTSLRIWCSCQGRDGQLWIGTSGQGVFSFAEGHFRPLSLREASLGSDVQAIHEDADGNLWLGTFSSGLVRLQARRVQTLDAGAGLPFKMASCLAVAPDGRAWVGYPGEGLFVRQGEHFEPWKMPPDGALCNLIRSLAVSAKGEIWAGTLGLGLLRFKDGTAVRFSTEDGLSDDEITAVATQGDGSVWAGTTAGTVHRLSEHGMETFEPPTGAASAPVSCILATASGSVYVATDNGGLAKVAGRQLVSLDSESKLRGVPIRTLYEETADRLWIGTQGKGLACETDGHLVFWDSKTGFPDNEVNGIVVDDLNRLWVNTRGGIYVISPVAEALAKGALPESEIARAYEPSSLAVLSRGWPQAVKAGDGRLWFVGPHEIYVLDPRDFHAKSQSLQVELETIRVNGQPLIFRHAFGTASTAAPSVPLSLPSSLRTLEFEFTAPSLDWPEQVQFQHRLDHFDKDWVDNAGERRVRYNGLPYGQYRFHVRARKPDGMWGDEATLEFELPPPFWRLPLVLMAETFVAVIAVVAGARVFFHRRLRLKLARISQQEAMERERMRIARDMHDEIGSRLTRISYFSELALQDEVPSRLSLQSIAGTIRDLLKTLDEIVWAVNPQNDTLENLAEYLGHYVTEYLQNTSVSCKLNIPANLPARLLSAETRHNVFLAFEEAVGNALRHSSATSISVEMNHHEGKFVIRIHDNGRGFDPAAMAVTAPAGGATGSPVRSRKGNGLVNMRERLAGVGGETRIDSHVGQGTTVTFSVPINTEPKAAR